MSEERFYSKGVPTYDKELIEKIKKTQDQISGIRIPSTERYLTIFLVSQVGWMKKVPSEVYAIYFFRGI
jgi:hypothetical protein